MKKIISIVIPVYNVEKYLSACLDSVIKQSYVDLDIILVDDGATDSSGVICDEYAKNDDRIRVLHCENGGLSAARNRGIKAAEGDFLTFVDSDDVIAPNMIEYLVNLLEEHASEIAICEIQHWYENKESNFEQSNESVTLNSEQAICDMWYQTSFLPSAAGKLYKKELFETISFPEGMIYEDIAIMHEVLWKAQKIVYGKAKLYGYLHRGDSITTKQFAKKNLDILKVCDKHRRFVQDKSDQLKKAAKAYEIVGCLRVYLNAPRNEQYGAMIAQCSQKIKKNWSTVYYNPSIRRKLKLSLILYRYFRPFMRVIYGRIDRWK